MVLAGRVVRGRQSTGQCGARSNEEKAEAPVRLRFPVRFLKRAVGSASDSVKPADLALLLEALHLDLFDVHVVEDQLLDKRYLVGIVRLCLDRHGIDPGGDGVAFLMADDHRYICLGNR